MATEDPRWRTWMAAAQTGDRAAYAALLAALLPHLRLAAQARWPSTPVSDIEDIVQDALIAFHESRHLYDPARPLLPFVHAILRFRGIDVLRRRQRRHLREMPIDNLDETSPALTSKENQEAGLERAALRRAMATLPPVQRRALALTRIAEMSVAEAAAKSGVSANALKVAVHRATRALRRRMKDDG